MSKQDPLSNYLSGLLAVIDKYNSCYRNNEGTFITKINDDKGFVDYSISGGPTERGKRKNSRRDDNE